MTPDSCLIVNRRDVDYTLSKLTRHNGLLYDQIAGPNYLKISGSFVKQYGCTDIYIYNRIETNWAIYYIYIYSKVHITLPGTNSLKVLVSDGAICWEGVLILNTQLSYTPQTT